MESGSEVDTKKEKTNDGRQGVKKTKKIETMKEGKRNDKNGRPNGGKKTIGGKKEVYG